MGRNKSYNRSFQRAYARSTQEDKTAQQPKTKDRPAIVANWLTIIGIIVNALMLFYTAKLFREASRQSENAEAATAAAFRSVQISDNALREQKYMDSVMRYREEIKDSADSVDRIITANNEIKRFKLQSSSTQAQIDALNIAQKNFQAQNEPYLQLSNFHVDTFEIGRPICTSVDIENLGVYPLKILSAVIITMDRPFPPEYSDKLAHSPQKNNIINSYVIKGSPIPMPAHELFPLFAPRAYKLMGGHMFLYYMGSIKYENLVNKQIKIYRFLLEVSFSHYGARMKYIKNDTENK